MEGEHKYVFVPRPKCPACGSPDLHTYGSHRRKREEYDIPGASYRSTVCRSCGHKFTKVVEGKSSRKRENRKPIQQPMVKVNR